MILCTVGDNSLDMDFDHLIVKFAQFKQNGIFIIKYCTNFYFSVKILANFMYCIFLKVKYVNINSDINDLFFIQQPVMN